MKTERTGYNIAKIVLAVAIGFLCTTGACTKNETPSPKSNRKAAIKAQAKLDPPPPPNFMNPID